MKIIKIVFIISITSISICQAYDKEEVKEMYTEDCTKCHDSKVFTRKERKVNNIVALKKQVRSCATNTGVTWFEEDEENVTAYLADTFYRFGK